MTADPVFIIACADCGDPVVIVDDDLPTILRLMRVRCAPCVDREPDDA